MSEFDAVAEVDRPPTLTTVAADRVREAIICGSLLPGSPLREIDLSKSLNVSRGTLRAALRQLQEEEGLVEVLPHRGAFVIRLSPRKAREIYTLRALLESYAVRLCVESNAYAKEDWRKLDMLADRLEQAETNGPVSDILKNDMEFHRLMCERCDHQMLIDMLRGLRSQTWLFIVHTRVYLTTPSEAESHRVVLEVIKQGDPVRAEEIVRAHISNSGNALQNRMTQMNWKEINAA